VNAILRVLQRLLEGSGDKSTLRGPGYVARVPDGFAVQPVHPMGGYFLLPPNSTPPPVSPAIVLVEPVHPMMLMTTLQHLHGMENPFLGQLNAAGLGLQGVTKLSPARQQGTPGGTAHIRELDGVSVSGQPLRMMVVVIVGTLGAAKVIIAVNLHRWNEFIGPCLQFLGSINASGPSPCPSNVFAVIDLDHRDEVEFAGGADFGSAVPWTKMPTRVEDRRVIEIHYHHHDESINIDGVINGTNIAIGKKGKVLVRESS